MQSFVVIPYKTRQQYTQIIRFVYFRYIHVVKLYGYKKPDRNMIKRILYTHCLEIEFIFNIAGGSLEYTFLTYIFIYVAHTYVLGGKKCREHVLLLNI